MVELSLFFLVPVTNYLMEHNLKWNRFVWAYNVEDIVLPGKEGMVWYITVCGDRAMSWFAYISRANRKQKTLARIP